MSEKRFGYGETDLFEWVEDNGEMISTKECVNKLNEKQELIEELQEENKQLKLTLSEYGVDLKAFEIFKQKIGYYDKVIDDE